MAGSMKDDRGGIFGKLIDLLVRALACLAKLMGKAEKKEDS